VSAGAASEGPVGLRRDASSDEPARRRSDTSFTVLNGDPTPEELAAVTAVIEAMIEERGADDARRAHGMSAWQRSQRSIREPLSPGYGAWRSFSG
jgi:hypothetical protein